ncbi:MAG: N-acetylmuramoyl-L-alanine amidase [Deltaproteobacteria bacterium]|nr:N-acetylmuramoyl-L-alanine amidase [Deltaproteobacteria bacterium]
MIKTTTTTKTALLLLIVLAIGCQLGCQNLVTTDPGHDDDEDPELSLVGDDLRASFTIEGGKAVSPVLRTSGANQLAVMAESVSDTPAAWARGVDDDVTGPWVAVEWTFAEAGLLAGRAALGDTFIGVQLAVDDDDDDALDALTFSGVIVSEGSDEFGDALAEPTFQTQALSPELAFVGVQPRSAWGARAPRCSTRDSSFNRIALHHTASRSTGDVHAMARQIQAYHMDGRGYCDAAYHFGVGQNGQIVELRPLPFRGGHTLNNNTQNIGVVFMGCFDGACGNDIPSAQLLEAGSGIVAMLSRIHGVAINSDRVRGHRDHAGQSTACPGGHLHPRLGDIRARAQQIKDGVSNTPPPPAGPPAAAGCGIAGVNRVLGRGEGVSSCGGAVSFVHQGDGNVVVYDRGRAVWSTGTHGRATDALVMQGDGNLVLYAPGGRPIFATGTHGHANTVLAVQDDGNVVLYAPGSRAIWSTRTSR